MGRKQLRREKRIEGNVVKRALYELQIASIPVKLLLGSDTGWPDQLFLLGFGRVLFIEFKDPDGALEPKQIYKIQILKDLGYDVQVHDNEEQALEAIARARMEAARLSEEG
tara:strand:+ start:16947 stop:17279 length:333 start_codon:yes stop_codon:yes gene_type:complete